MVLKLSLCLCGGVIIVMAVLLGLTRRGGGGHKGEE